MLPWASKAKAVGRYKSANLISEKPCETSAPFNSTLEAGIVGIGVGVSVVVGCGIGVSVGKDIVVEEGEVAVLVTD